MTLLKRHVLLWLTALPLAAAPPAFRPDRVPQELFDTLPEVGLISSPDIELSDLVWTDNLDTGLMRARASGQQVMALFSTPTCSWCRRLKEEVLADPGLRSALRRFTLVEINTDRNPGPAMHRGIRSVPTLVWMDANGRELFRVSGFLSSEDLAAVLEQLLTPGEMPVSARNAGLLRRLTEEEPSPELLAEAVSRLPDQDPGGHIREALRNLDPMPVNLWVELLEHSRLVVRLGALERLEELAGTARGFDPWANPSKEDNRASIVRWRTWLEDDPEMPSPRARYARLSREQLDEAVEDLSAELPERANRAMRTLELAGPAVLPHLLTRLEDEDFSGEQRERLEEVILSLKLTRLGWADPSTTARRLRHAPRETRLNLLRSLREIGPEAAPVLLTFIDDPDILVREAVIEGLIRRGRPEVLPRVLAHLETESSMDVAVTAMRNLRHATDSTRENTAVSDWLKTQLEFDHEERILGALNAVREGHHPSLIPAVTELLEDPRWRVRAEVARTLGGTRSRESLATLLEHARDPDPFARTIILQTALGLAENSQQRTRMLENWWDEFPEYHTALLRIACDSRVELPDAFFESLTDHSHDDLVTILGIVESCVASRIRTGLQLAEHTDPDVRAAAVRLLARHGLSAEGRERREAEAHLVRALGQADDNQRIALIDNVRLPRQSGTRSGGISSLLGGLLQSSAASDAPSDPVLDDLLGAFGDDETTDPEPEASALDDLLGAFEEPSRSAPSSEYGVSLQDRVLEIFRSTEDETLRHVSSRLLVEMGNDEALPHLLAHADTHPEEDLSRLLTRPGHDQLILQAARELLDDPRDSVRSAALLQMASRDFSSGLLSLIYDDSSTLRPRDVPWNRHQLHQQFRERPLREVRPYILRGLATESTDTDIDFARLSLALILAAHHRHSAFLEPLQAHTENLRHPELRAQAWIARARQSAPLTEEEIDRVASDSATRVRFVLPWMYLRTDSKTFTWNILPDLAFSHTERNPTPRLTPYVEEHLARLLHDSVPEIQVAAGSALISQGQVPEDVSWLSALSRLENPSENAGMIWNGIESRVPRLSADYRPLINWLSQQELWRAEDRLALWRSRNAEDRAEPEDEEAGAGTAFIDDTPTDGVASDAPAADGDTAVTLLYFYSEGCPDCELVREILNSYRSLFPELSIREYNIIDPGSEDLYYEIFLAYGLPLSQVGLTPMIAGSGGADFGGDNLDYNRIGDIVAQSVSIPGTEWIPTPRPVTAELDTEEPAPQVESETEAAREEEAPKPVRDPRLPPELSPWHSALLLMGILLTALLLPVPPRPAHGLPAAALILLAALPLHIPPAPVIAALIVALFSQAGRLFQRRQSFSLATPIQAPPASPSPRTLLLCLILPLIGLAFPLPLWLPAAAAIPVSLYLVTLVVTIFFLTAKHGNSRKFFRACSVRKANAVSK